MKLLFYSHVLEIINITNFHTYVVVNTGSQVNVWQLSLLTYCIFFFSCSSAILSTLPCQVSYRLAFQSQPPKAESPDLIFLWKILMKQLGKSEQNSRFGLQTRVLGPTALDTLHVAEFTPQGFQQSHTHTQVTHAQTQAQSEGFVGDSQHCEAAGRAAGCAAAPYPPTGNTEGTRSRILLFLHFLQTAISRPQYMGQTQTIISLTTEQDLLQIG